MYHNAYLHEEGILKIATCTPCTYMCQLLNQISVAGSSSMRSIPVCSPVIRHGMPLLNVTVLPTADRVNEVGSMGRSWAERKVAHPQKLSRPSLSGLFTNVDTTDAPRGHLRSNLVLEADESGEQTHNSPYPKQSANTSTSASDTLMSLLPYMCWL